MPRALILLASLFPLVALADEPRPPLTLASLPEPGNLAALLLDRSPGLQAARLRVASARADLDHANLLPNPGLDVSWNTIPIGETNPPHLDHPLTQVPNYAFGLSSLVEIGKRGPRQRAAADAYAAAIEDARASLFDTYFELEEKIAVIAAAEARTAEWAGLAEDARKLTELQRARAERGDTALLDVDRSALEEEKLWTALADERATLAAGLRDCGSLVGARCEPFGSAAAAEAHLNQAAAGGAPLEERPDLRSLELQRASASEALSLARAHAIPDPTFRVGYVRDQFLISGNQRNSLFVGVSLPLTLFDHGQVDARLAESALMASARTRDLLIEQTKAQVVKLGEERRALEERRARLREKTLPLARSVVSRLQEIVRRGGAPLQEVLLARRTLGELTVEATALDLSARQLSIALARARGDGPPTSSDLTVRP